MSSESPAALEIALMRVLNKVSSFSSNQMPPIRMEAPTPNHECWIYACFVDVRLSSFKAVAAIVTVMRPRNYKQSWLVQIEVWGSEILFRLLTDELTALELQSVREYIVTECKDSPKPRCMLNV